MHGCVGGLFRPIERAVLQLGLLRAISIALADVGCEKPGPPRDTDFDGFISPMTNPVFFEDPRNLTEIRPIFVHHRMPDAAGGGYVNVIAAQVRYSLTENISLIATKDGFVTSDNPLIDDGWADVAAGLKFNLFTDPCRQTATQRGVDVRDSCGIGTDVAGQRRWRI